LHQTLDQKLPILSIKPPDFHTPHVTCRRFALKQILWYLKTINIKGMIQTSTIEHQGEYYIDANFSGNPAVEHSQDPAAVKSGTKYLTM
jgi:hypothetical protein